MGYVLNFSLFLFAATPYGLLPFVVLKIRELDNHSDDLIAFEAECVIVRALAASTTVLPEEKVPRRKWLVAAIFAAMASTGFQTLNAATTAKMTISAIVVVTCKIFVSAVRGEKEKISSSCDSPANRAIEPAVHKDDQKNEIIVSY